MRPFTVLVLLVSFMSFSCRKDAEVVEPYDAGGIFLSDTKPLRPPARAAMEGVYRVLQGQDVFGDYVALKWSGVSKGADTSFLLSGFYGRDAAFSAVSGGSLDSTFFFSGTWRKMTSTETGLMRWTVLSSSGGRQLMKPSPVIGRDSITIYGTWGNGEENPSRNVTLRYDRPLYRGKRFEIIAHRGGGRTSDMLPVSENSVEMILYAERLGCTWIEIDVRPTKDGVPVLYHDNTMNLRLIQKCGLVGEIEEYTYDQLQTLVRLIHGEKLPTFREVLDAALYRTKLRGVYIDTKPTMPVNVLAQIQQEYTAKAAAAGREFELLIGIPSDDKINELKAIPNYTQIPSLCELTVDDARTLNSKAWAPRWTMGTQSDKVAQIQAEGRRAFVWTLDVPEYVQQFIGAGYDGILTNYSPMVAYYNYVR